MSDKQLNLALQGGGSHGAYTWGVLDRLFDEEDIVLTGISGTSAGAMNAAVASSGFRAGRHRGAKAALAEFWGAVSAAGAFSPLKTTPFEHWRDGWNLDGSMSYELFDLATRMFSPYQLNPFNLNPLREILARVIDWKLINDGGDIPLFITATSVRTGRPRVFTCGEITPDVLLASSCIPMYFQTVEVGGEAYWDGGYMGNPSIWPLIYNTDPRDVLLVQINPLVRDEVPKKASDIVNRLNEITFNSSLIAEMRAINFAAKLLDENHLDDKKYKRILMHMIPAPGAAYNLNASSKLNTDMRFLESLRDIGRGNADIWIKENKESIGAKATVDIEAVFLGTGKAATPPKRAVKKASRPR
ncbi:MAG: patatin-like phospholipase family protein [Alphaproteobacteria bacterium]|nr:patatin-like phospholipase family protein [Alphaproteobacteria bacterium]